MHYPRGWYFACFGEDLRRGRVLPVEYFGRRWALYRTRSGAVGMIDARCRHRGADLALAGRVRGERLMCGYHGWEYAADGAVTHAPRVDRLPRAACVESRTVREAAGNVWVWHGEGTPDPFPDVSALDGMSWTKGETFVGYSELLPIAEHVADAYHFPVNHKVQARAAYRVLRNEGPYFEMQLLPAGDRPERATWFFRTYAFAEFAGPGTSFYYALPNEELDRRRAIMAVIIAHTPIGPDRTRISWRVAARKWGPDFPMWPIHRAFARMLWFLVRRNVEVDRQVLRHMHSGHRPLSVAADGEVLRAFQDYFGRCLDGPETLRPDGPDEGGRSAADAARAPRARPAIP